MNKVFFIVLGIVIILGIIGFTLLLIRSNRPELAREITKASAEFKADQNFRPEPAKKLVPHLKIGMTKQDVEALLGKPNEIKKSDNGSYYWFYVLGYSQFIDVQFDSNGILQKIEACAPGLSDTGYYKLEK